MTGGSYSENRNTHKERKKTRVNHVMLNWDGRYYCDFMVFNIYGIDIKMYVKMHIYIYEYASMHVFTDIYIHTYNIP